MDNPTIHPISLKRMMLFFIPLGLSASMVTVSHVIINATLARAENASLVIASYAIGLSLLGVTERPSGLLRQTGSALVRDRVSFQALTKVAYWLFGSLLLLGALISYTPIGTFIFRYLYGVAPDMVEPIVHVYRILMFVSIFSGIRCLYQGIIISQMKTKWLTIGMALRLTFMFLIAQAFILSGHNNSGMVGAIIFLLGMMIECSVSFLEGRKLVRTLPKRIPDYEITTASHVFTFYKPMLYSSFIAVAIGPLINAMLGKTTNLTLAIAAFAIAASVTQLVLSFFTYVHQLVLNFYKDDPGAVKRFLHIVCLLPTLLLLLLCYTPIGTWFMSTVMGVSADLLTQSLQTLRVFIIFTLVFPWLDFANGLIMLRGQTKVMLASQAANLTITLITLIFCILITPGWNGMVGALAQSLGCVAELAIVAIALHRLSADKLLATRIKRFFSSN